MSEDKLKQFIDENRELFEEKAAPARVWNRIEQDLQGKSTKKIFSMKQMLFVLGFVLLLFTSGIFLGSKYFGEESELQYAQIEDQEYLELENYYNPLLENQEEKFISQVKLTEDNPILDELKQLDNGFEELKSDFVNSKSNNKEMMMYLMKENYELRIKILEMAMERMGQDSANFSKNNNYEIIEY